MKRALTEVRQGQRGRRRGPWAAAIAFVTFAADTHAQTSAAAPASAVGATRGPSVSAAQRAAPSAAPSHEPAPVVDAPDPIESAAALEATAKRPGDLVTLSLEKVDLPELVRAMSALTGKRFLIAASPKAFEATIIASQKVTVEQAYRAFLSLLAANHLTVVPSGRFTKIIDAQDAVRSAPVQLANEAPSAEDRYVTYVHRPRHLSADEVAQGVLSKIDSRDGSVLAFGGVLLLTDTEANVKRMLRVLDQLDVAQPEDQVWLEPLEYVTSVDVKRELEELVDPKVAAAAPADAMTARVTRLVAIEHPNALIVVGSAAGYARLLELLRALDVPSPNDGQMHVVSLEHSDAKKIVGPINEAVAGASSASAGGRAGLTILTGPVKVSAEETNNALIVTASAHDFAAIREVIRRLDQPRRQVYIEAVIMDLTVARVNELDTALHGFGDVSGALGSGSLVYGGSNPLKSLTMPTDSSSLQALVLGIRGPSISVPSFLQGALGTSSIPGLGFFLDAYATTDDADILSTPHILATDNVPADIRAQLNTSLQRNASSYAASSTGASGTAAALSSYALSAPASANYGKIGPEIKVTPHLNASDEVRLDVVETISDLTADPPQGTLGTINYVERAAETTLTVQDGHTVVIGGLVRDKVTRTVTKIPLLGDLPLFGALFRSSKDTVEKDNLVLILTPHIIRDESDLRRVFEDRMRERQEFLDHALVFGERSPTDFDPRRGRGLLLGIRRSFRDDDSDRDPSGSSLTRAPASHRPGPPMALPNGRGGAPSAPPASDEHAQVAPAGPLAMPVAPIDPSTIDDLTRGAAATVHAAPMRRHVESIEP